MNTNITSPLALNEGGSNQLRQMLERDPLTPLHEQEIEQIWRLRCECHYFFPSSLPKLLDCVHWNNHVEVAQVYMLVDRLLGLSPETACFGHTQHLLKRNTERINVLVDKRGFEDRKRLIRVNKEVASRLGVWTRWNWLWLVFD